MVEADIRAATPADAAEIAALHVADPATVDRAPHGVPHLAVVPAQEALAVADRLVLAREPAIDDLLKHAALLCCDAGRAPGRPKPARMPPRGAG